MVVDPRLQGAVRVTVLATGFESRVTRKVEARPATHTQPDPEPQPARVPSDTDLDIPAFLRRR
jgi:cell division GTPase FtsZ